MGCVCAKGIIPDGDGEPHRAKSLKRFVTTSRKEEPVAATADFSINGSLSNRREKVAITLSQPIGDGEKKAECGAGRTVDSGHHSRLQTVDRRADRRAIGDGPEAVGVVDVPKADSEIVNAPNGFSGEHAVPGWPAWLTAVAGDAIMGWQPRRASSFEKLDKIGQGTYSTVYRARDLETGKIVALKKVRFVNMDPESVRFMAREIHVLRRLDHPNVMKLEGIIASQKSCNLYLVFEYMEHDLAGLAARPGLKFTEAQVKCFMGHLLEGLAHCHSRGILHRDIKGSNLLVNNNGILKIADFGLATILNPHQKQLLTSRVVTLWYRPPELLLGATEYGVAVDLWSSGCILAELLARKPIMPGRTEVEQLHKIFKLCGSPSDEYWKKAKLPHTTIFKPQHHYKRCISETFKDFPTSALSLLDSLLSIEPENRGTAVSALDSDFFKSKPFACDPSSLPKCPPSKEYDAKLQNEKIRRQRAEASTERSDSIRQGKRETKEMPGANVEMQKRPAQTNTKSCSYKYNSEDESGSGFPMNLVRTAENGFYHSGMIPRVLGSSLSKNVSKEDPRIPERSYSFVRASNGPLLQKQGSYMHLSGSAYLSSSTVARSSTNSRYIQLDVAELSDKHALERPASTHRKDDRNMSREPTVGYGAKNKRIHYSGPLMPPGVNVDDMLKEHERLIQQAMRKARLDKVKTKKNI